MSRPAVEVADILHAQGDTFLAQHPWLTVQQRSVLRAIARCRTAALGGHVDRCDACGHQAISDNSCRNRHCPKCQAQARERDLLDVPYVHVVFTLPHGLLPLAYRNSARLYTWLFQASAATLREVAAFVEALRHAYHRTALDLAGGSEHLHNATAWRAFLNGLFETDWVVYAKPAFGGAPAVLRYLGRYTHRVAISNHRLLAFDGEHVTFAYKDYARGNKRRTMRLTAMEFLRRFVQHILPRGFVRIRQSGFLANTCRVTRVARARTILTTSSPSAPTNTDTSPAVATWVCPRCGAAMIVGPILSALHLATVTWSLDSS